MSQELPLEIDCLAVRQQLEEDGELVLIDCREPDEHQIVHIAGARLLPMSELEARLSELDGLREARIAVHCHHGGRSLKVALWLRAKGFCSAQSMAGGIDRWSLEIDPSLPRY